MIDEAKKIIAEFGNIRTHDLVHELCVRLGKFGEINGATIAALDFSTKDYPKYIKTKSGFRYIETAPAIEEII